MRRDKADPLSPVRNVWNLLDNKLRFFYSPEPFLTVDEQLVEYHGRVSFRMYIPSKPGAYGLEIMWLNEATTGYALKGLPYIGIKTLTNKEKGNMPITEAVTLYLMKPYLNLGYNITCDNWFTTVQLADHLCEKNTTLVGTIRQNRKDIPPAAKNKKGRQKKSAIYYISKKKVLCSFKDKKISPILLLSTMHTSAKTLNNGIPQIVDFYNPTKGGTDNMDHMLRLYRLRRKCNR